MGVGFVNAVMAGVVADSVDKKTGLPNKFVIGCFGILAAIRHYFELGCEGDVGREASQESQPAHSGGN